ncbi:MAG: hypothetical protein E7497_07075 [Ruminococcus sp.]|nr:hypothetical protein [Ruminococcus sp.]
MKTKRFLGILLTITMVMSLLPTFTLTASAAETEEATQKNITLGTSALKGGQQSNVYFGTYQQSSLGATKPTDGTEGVDWIKSDTATQNSQGAYYSKDPIKWRVLSKADGKAFLLSDKNIDVVRYQEDYEDVTWKTSTIRSWLNGYGSSSNQSSIDYSSTNSGGKDNFIDYAFSTSEKALIADTSVVNSNNPWHDTSGGDDTTDKIFLLSIAEVENAEYGFTDQNARKSVNTAYVTGGGHAGASRMYRVGSADDWRLRSPGSSANYAAYVNSSGVFLDRLAAEPAVATRPAFNLNLSSVLFTSAAENGKKSGFNAVEYYSGNDYKLTFKDSNRNFSVSDKSAKTVKMGDTLSFGFSNAKSGTNEYISAMIVDESGDAVYYGQLTNATSASGTANLTVPSDIAYGTYTLKLFNEQINGDYKTDYSSDFVNINLLVEHPHSYTDGFCSCGAYEEPEIKDNYYQIENAGQLYWFANHINNDDRTANAVLVADIDLEGKSDGTGRKWTPIGSTGENSNNFRGHFDGRNHTITNLYIDETRAGIGLFGEVRLGTVENFTIYGDVKLYGDCSYVGGVIGSAPGANGTDVPDHNGATIRNITSYVDVTLVENAHGSSFVGGFIGYANHETIIENCSWYGTLDLGAYRADSGVGGLVGRLYDKSNVTIRNCGAYGTIKTSYKSGTHNNYDTIYIGGVLSYSPAKTLAVLENNLWAGNFVNDTDLGNKAHLSAFGTLNGEEVVTNCCTIDSAPYLTTENVNANGITIVTMQQLASGEVAYLLQGEQTTEVWGQDLTKENSLPVLDGDKVYLSNGIYYNEVKEFEILSNGTSGTKATATVAIPTAGTYTLVFADYEEATLNNMDFVTVTAESDNTVIIVPSEIDITLGTDDKIMLWQDMTSLVPLCEAYILK